MDHQQNSQSKIILIAEANSIPCRLDKFISQSIEKYSRNAIQELISHSLVTINDKIVTSRKALVQPEDVIQVNFAKSKSSPIILPNNEIKIDLIYEDEWLAIINKPAGLVMHPGAGTTDETLANALLSHYGASNLSHSDTIKPGIVNRLDKETSGLIIIAKSDHIHNLLTLQFKERTIKKTYLAVVHGVVKAPLGTIHTKITKSNHNHKKMMVTKDRGLEAITHYRVLATHSNISLLQCQIETGRTHQIRLHMAYQGHPILRDTLYGKQFNPSAKDHSSRMIDAYSILSRQALHSYKLAFSHPIATKKSSNELEFTAPIPQDMMQIIDNFANFYF